MTIGIDCRLYSPRHTGIGRYVYELVTHLMDLDHENHYILYINPEEFERLELPNGRWQRREINIPHYSLSEQMDFYRLLEKEDLDLMYFPHFNAPIRYRKPFVVTIHDLTLHYFPHKSYNPHYSLKSAVKIAVYKFIMRKVLKNAKQIIAVSEHTRQDLLREYPFTEGKLQVLLEGVPDSFRRSSDEEVRSVREKYHITKPYLLYTGVWRSHKNLLTLIRSFDRLLKDGQDIQLVFTGKKDTSYPEIPALIEELGLGDRVVLTGFVPEEDLIALNSGARVFVFPSLYEGFGLPPLEAMRFHVPVTCSNVASIPEVCGNAALYFDPRNEEEMSTCVKRLLTDEKLRYDMIEKGQLNLQRFSWQSMAAQMLDIFNSK